VNTQEEYVVKAKVLELQHAWFATNSHQACYTLLQHAFVRHTDPEHRFRHRHVRYVCLDGRIGRKTVVLGTRLMSPDSDGTGGQLPGIPLRTPLRDGGHLAAILKKTSCSSDRLNGGNLETVCLEGLLAAEKTHRSAVRRIHLPQRAVTSTNDVAEAELKRAQPYRPACAS
jgi:hypothetical protein